MNKINRDKIKFILRSSKDRISKKYIYIYMLGNVG